MSKVTKLLLATVACVSLTAASACTINIGPQSNHSSSPGSGSVVSTSPSKRSSAGPGPAPSSLGSSGVPSPSSSSPTWTDLIAQVRSGVVRVQVAGCDQQWTGTGFMLSDRDILTAGHVARNAASISVRSGSQIVRADVVKYDMPADTALLRTRQDLKGYHFMVDATKPREGTDIKVLGYPFGVTDVRSSPGEITSDEEQPVTYGGPEGFTVRRTITTSAPVNGGNSGGPVLDHDGHVVALVTGQMNWSGDPSNEVPAQGTNYLVPADVISNRYQEWRALDAGSVVANCAGADDGSNSDALSPDVVVIPPDPDAYDIAESLFVHGDSINRGLYDVAWAVYTPAEQRRVGDFNQWARDHSSSYWTTITVKSVERHGHHAHADVDVTTHQDAAQGFDGQTCSQWSFNYAMRLSAGFWQINYARTPNPRAC